MSMDDDLALVLKAADFAAVKHRDQRRKNGDIPYINHPLGVARILREAGGVRDGATLAAALLHDTVEDTRTSPIPITRFPAIFKSISIASSFDLFLISVFFIAVSDSGTFTRSSCSRMPVRRLDGGWE